jgi:hypothetical protein
MVTMKKLFSLAAAALLVGSLASVSAFAADAPKKATTKPHHMMSCNDYAYESQAMKDCMAKGDAKATKASASKKAKAPAAKKAM